MTNSGNDRSSRTPRSGGDVPRRGDRNRNNSSFGESRGRNYRSSSEGARDTRSNDPAESENRGRRREHGAYTGGRNDRRGERRGRPDDGRGRGRFDQRDRRNGDGHDRRSRDGDRGGAQTRIDAPDIPEDITPQDLEPEIRRDLRTLNKENADAVSRHLVAAMWALEENPQLALRHARAAKSRAGRIGVVREMLGVIAYNCGEWAETLSELRAARRLQGGPGLISLMADAERGLERPERAIELARSEEAQQLEDEDKIELKIVEAGARVDLEQIDAALVTLEDAGLSKNGKGEQAARLAYAYADVLAAADRIGEARVWFESSLAADEEATDAQERLDKLA